VNIVALGSLKHSPGVTTLALALTHAVAERTDRIVLLDADPAGGDVAAYVGTPTEPGLVTLAAACRHPEAHVDLNSHARPLPNGGSAVVAPGTPSQAAAALGAIATRVRDAGASDDVAVIDCGRLAVSSPTLPVIDGAGWLVVLVRPTVAGVSAVVAQAGWLRSLGAANTGLVVQGERPYAASEVEGATGLPVIAVAPIDMRGAEAAYGALPQRAERRTPLGRAARSLADTLFPCGTETPRLSPRVEAVPR
jgi:MinD-like ATPase involved in chromosome partitioning or flagellar assembly